MVDKSNKSQVLYFLWHILLAGLEMSAQFTYYVQLQGPRVENCATAKSKPQLDPSELDKTGWNVQAVQLKSEDAAQAIQG